MRRSVGCAIAGLSASALVACSPSYLPAPAHPLSGAPEALSSGLGSDVELVLARVDRADVRVRLVAPERTPLIARWLERQGLEARGLVSSVHTGEGECERPEAADCTNGDLRVSGADGREVPEVDMSPPRAAQPEAIEALLWAVGVATLATPTLSALTGTDLVSPPTGAPPSEAAVEAHAALMRERESVGFYERRVVGDVTSYGRLYETTEAPIARIGVEAYLCFGARGDRTRCIVSLSADGGPLFRGEREDITLDRQSVDHIECAPIR